MSEVGRSIDTWSAVPRWTEAAPKGSSSLTPYEPASRFVWRRRLRIIGRSAQAAVRRRTAAWAERPIILHTSHTRRPPSFLPDPCSSSPRFFGAALGVALGSAGVAEAVAAVWRLHCCGKQPHGVLAPTVRAALTAAVGRAAAAVLGCQPCGAACRGPVFGH